LWCKSEAESVRSKAADPARNDPLPGSRALSNAANCLQISMPRLLAFALSTQIECGRYWGFLVFASANRRAGIPRGRKFSAAMRRFGNATGYHELSHDALFFTEFHHD